MDRFQEGPAVPLTREQVVVTISMPEAKEIEFLKTPQRKRD
jgi:hypothetical protein